MGEFRDAWSASTGIRDPIPADSPAVRPPDALRQVIRANLDGRAVLQIHDLARLFGITAKAVQRALQEHGTSFQELLDEVRCERAMSLMRDPAQTLTGIGSSLGYTDPANFSRAFKRWSGLPPRTFRKTLATGDRGAAVNGRLTPNRTRPTG